MNWWLGSGGVLLWLLVAFFPVVSGAATFTSMVDIPGVDGAADSDFSGYINALYIFAITIGALLAVLKLVAAGVKYMFSDIVTNKEAAKNDIKGALLGLLIVIGAVVILDTINTDLTDVDLNIENVEVSTFDTLDFINRLRTAIDACVEPDCVIRNCPLDRDGSYLASCRTWCENTGTTSTFIQNGLIRYYTGNSEQVTHQCLVNVVNPASETSLNCPSRDTTGDGFLPGYDCNAAETYCRDILNGVPRIVSGGTRVECGL